MLKLCAFADEAGTSLKEQLNALTDNDIRLIEARSVEGINVADWDAATVKTIKREMDARDIAVWALGSPFGKIKITEPFQPHFEKFRRCLDTALSLEAGVIRIFSFYIPSGADRLIYRDEVFDRLSQFAQAAKRSGVLLCHENEKGIYGDNAARCVDLLNGIPSIRGVFDPANFAQVGQNILSAWDSLSPFIHYLHVKDCSDDRITVPAGKGTCELPLLLEQFAALGRSDVISLEPHLFEFSGLKALENDEKTMIDGQIYRNGREAFDDAVRALKEILPKEI